ncbi:MAG TPA: branched-chain amino acid ABC transporter permease [Candidatus Methylomirabilis sp.]|nr:branched-chain amino acid ABC transporter permease [Candidatus Methylomirabilis sp.]
MIEQLLVKGLSLGAIYSMIAIGFCLLWQTSRLVNFAEGEFVTIPAFLMVLFYSVLAVPYPLAILLAILVAALLLGVVMKKTLVDALITRGNTPFVVTTIALGFFVKDFLTVFATPEALNFPSMVRQTPLHFAGAVFSSLDLWNIVVAAVLILGVNFFIRKSKPGKALQAVAQNREAAVIMGIDAQKMILLAFSINAVLVAFAAALAAPIYMVKYDMGNELGLKAFYAAIIGGFNQVRGALLGGLLVGLIETFTAAYISTQYKSGFVLLVLIAVILFRPEGLLGTKEQ